MQKSTLQLLHRAVLGVTPSPPLPTHPPGGGGRQDGAAAGVFQIITSGCGGGGSPWQPQCLQHPTTEGNRATERRNPVLSCCGLWNPDARARARARTGRKRFSADIGGAFALPLMELNKQLRISNPRMYFPRCFFLRTHPNKILPLL